MPHFWEDIYKLEKFHQYLLIISLGPLLVVAASYLASDDRMAVQEA